MAKPSSRNGSVLLPNLSCVLLILYAAVLVFNFPEGTAAQPLVPSPLMPLVAGVLGPSATSSSSIVNPQTINGWAFTTDGLSVYAQNLMDPNITAPGKLPGPPYRDTPTTSITQLVKVSGVGILAIAGSQLLFYQCNATAAWRASSFSAALGYSFDLISSNSGSGPLPYYPAQGTIPSTGATVVFLGTQRTVSPFVLSSTVYAMRVPTLTPAWSTTVASDTTAFTSWTDNATVVYIAAQNRSINDYISVCSLTLATGAVRRCDYTTNTIYNVVFGVFGQLLVLVATYSVTVLNVTTGNYIDDISATCVTNVLPPTMINGTIYAMCTYDVITVSSSTGAAYFLNLATTLLCAARNPTNGDVLLVTNYEQVYVLNASGLVMSTTLPDGEYSTGSCTGATFDYIPGAPSDVRNNYVYLTFTTSYYGGGVIVYNYKSGATVGQLTTKQITFGSVAIDRWTSNLLVVGLDNGRNIMQVFDPNSNTAAQQSKWSYSYLASIPSYTTEGSVINGSTVFVVAYYNLYSIDWRGVVTSLYAFPLSVSVQDGPWIVGQYLVVVDNYYNRLYRFDASNNYAATIVTGLCDLAVNQDVVITGTKIIFSCDELSQPAAIAFDLSATTPTLTELSSASSSFSTAGVGVVFDSSSKYVIVPTTSTEVRAFSTSSSSFPVRWTTTLGTIVSNPVVWNGFAYIIAYPTSSTSTTAPYIPTLYALETIFGVSLTIGPMYVNKDSYDKLLVIKSGGVFGGALLYVIGNQNITAYTTSMAVFFSYSAINGSVYTRSSYAPRAAVLDNTGALAFYDSYGFFNVLNGFRGTLLWRYQTSSSGYPTHLMPIVADNQSIYFNNGYDVIGADVFSGRTNTMLTYTSTYYNLVSASFAINNSGYTTIAAVKEYQVVVQTINTTRSMWYSGGPQPRLPGAGSAPNTGATGFGAAAAGKGWVAAVVIGVLLIVAAGGYRAHRSRQATAAASVAANGGYALMQPAPINAVATSYPQQPQPVMSYSPHGGPPPGQYHPGGMMVQQPPGVMMQQSPGMMMQQPQPGYVGGVMQQPPQQQQPMMTVSYGPGGPQQPGQYSPSGYVPPPGTGYAAPQQHYGDVAL